MPEDETVERVAVWPENDAGIERYIPQADRDKIDSADFAGPDRSFPIDTQAHLEAAAHLIGHAADPAAVKAKAIRIAKRKGFKLPKAWQTGGDDKSSDRADMPEQAMLYAPITRIDKEKREVEGLVTSEALDSYKTIFSYEGSKRAFQRWVERTANVREMHDRKAVAKGVGVVFDDDNRNIWLRSRISRGAPDTWAKVEENILTGYSVGATKPVWGKIERDGETYPYLLDYELTEVSLVDNPSNPDAFGLTICRADGLTDLIDTAEPEEPAPTPEPVTSPTITEPEVERAGARISTDTKSAVHGARDSAMQSAMQMMKVCDCPDCQAMTRALDPDNDGDIDVAGADSTLDPDHDASKMAERIAEILLARMVQELHTPISRMHAIAGTFARSHAPDIDISPIQRSLEDIVSRLATVPTQSSLDEVCTSLEVVKGQVERIAAQPMPGGPVLNGARPVDKSFSPGTYQPPVTDTYAVLERLQAAGVLNTQEKQVAAAALAVIPTRGRMG